MIQSRKRQLRKTIKTELLRLSDDDKQNKSREIAKNLVKTDFWKKAEAVLCYLSMDDEVKTENIIKLALEEKKILAIPHMHGKEMDFHVITSLDMPWDHHHYGIKEPRQEWPLLEAADYEEGSVLLITPGLAFDRKGYRLGRGKGFYDRYFEKYCGIVIPVALCFALQIVPEVPAEDHDCVVNALITENECIEIRKND